MGRRGNGGGGNKKKGIEAYFCYSFESHLLDAKGPLDAKVRDYCLCFNPDGISKL